MTTYNGPSSLERHIGFVEEIEKDNGRPGARIGGQETPDGQSRLTDSTPWTDRVATCDQMPRHAEQPVIPLMASPERR